MTALFEQVDPLRRRIMSAVRRRDTKPEMVVRRLLHSMNYRYRTLRDFLEAEQESAASRKRIDS